ncbi:MAG: hypothetical protein WC525_04960 [Candidatus Thermoplasmatota archaeon]
MIVSILHYWAAQQIKQLQQEPTDEDLKEHYRQSPTSETIRLSPKKSAEYKKALKI